MIRIRLFTLMLLTMVPITAWAQAAFTPQGRPANAVQSTGALPDALVIDIADYARKQLPNAKNPDGTAVGPESPGERSERFLLPFNDLKRVARRGAVSFYASSCGLDWENRSYLPFMSNEVRSGRWTDKQIVYIGLVHEITQGAFEHNLKGKPCPDNVRTEIGDALYPAKPTSVP